jgi:hypothetical protein
VDCIDLAKDREQQTALANAVMNHLVSQKVGYSSVAAQLVASQGLSYLISFTYAIFTKLRGRIVVNINWDI